MEKLRVRYPVIVEGRYDKARLCSFLSGDIIQTDGFRLFSDKKKLALIRRLAQADKVVVLTDSDRAGFRIRGHIAGAVPPEKLIHVYIPQVPGKERRKARPSAEGTLGVEGMDAEVLREALEKAGALADSQPPERPPITKGDLYALGLSGGTGSAALRRRLLRRLDLPEGIGANALPGVLARLVTLEELAALTARLREEEEDRRKEMEPIHYFVTKIEGDYAILVPESCPQPVELPVALALLPDGIGEGARLLYDNLEYTVL